MPFGFLRRNQPATPERTREAVWVCVGHPCKDLGSKGLLGPMRAALKRNGLEGRVRFREAACLALCGAGPNVKVMPDRVRYWETSEDSLDVILQRHYCDPARDYAEELAADERVESGTVVKAPHAGDEVFIDTKAAGTQA